MSIALIQRVADLGASLDFAELPATCYSLLPVVHYKNIEEVSCSLLLKEYHCSFTTKQNNISSLHTIYTSILSLLHDIEPKDNFFMQRRRPKLSDKQLLALILATEALGIDSERYLFRRLPRELSDKIERSVYNRRRRNLASKFELFRPQDSRCMYCSGCY